MSFKENLKMEISYNNVSVKELSRRAGIKKRAIDNYLRTKGAAIPSAETAVKIAQALGVSVEFLVLGESPEVPRDIRLLNKNLLRVSHRDRKVVASLVDSMIEYQSKT